MKVINLKKRAEFEPLEIKLTLETFEEFITLHSVIEQTKGVELLDGLFDFLEKELIRLRE